MSEFNEEYKATFPEEVVRVRESVEERITEAKDELETAKAQLESVKEERETLKGVEKLWTRLDNDADVEVELNRSRGEITITAWVSSLETAYTEVLLKELDGSAMWESVKDCYKIEATVTIYTS